TGPAGSATSPRHPGPARRCRPASNAVIGSRGGDNGSAVGVALASGLSPGRWVPPVGDLCAGTNLLPLVWAVSTMVAVLSCWHGRTHRFGMLPNGEARTVM